jgi:hypothetical protein
VWQFGEKPTKYRKERSKDFKIRAPRGSRKLVHVRQDHALAKSMASLRSGLTIITDLLDKKNKNTYQGVRVSNVIYEPADTSAASPFVDLNTDYRFRLGGHTTLATTGGVIDTFVACDPSPSGWNSPEWSTLSSLFSEFRLIKLSVQFVRANWIASGVATVSNPTLLIAGNLGTAIAPGSYAALADNADSKMWSACDTSPTGYTHTLSGKQLGWSQVTTPTTEPFAGAPGSIQIYGTFGGSSTAGVVHVLISGIYEFRSRV